MSSEELTPEISVNVNICLLTYPCQHMVSFKNNDKHVTKYMSCNWIFNKYKELGMEIPAHFKYCNTKNVFNGVHDNSLIDSEK